MKTSIYMKQTWIVAAIALSAAACQSNGSKNFTVTGEVKNAPATVVYLEQISFENMPPQVLDSITVTNGKFTLKGKAAEESLLQLRFPQVENSPLFFVINDKSDITLTGDWSDIRKLSYKGSHASERLREYVDSLTATQQKLYMMQNEIQNGVQDSLGMIKQTEMTNMVTAFKTYVKKTAMEDKSPMLSMFATSINIGTDVAENEAMFNSLVKRFPKHAGIQAVVKQFRESTANAAPPKQGTPAIGTMAPDITMPDVNGTNFSLSSLKGKYVLVDFWASWCGPCRAENPNLVKEYNAFKSKNFTILSVSLDNTKDKWLEAIKKDGLTWTHVSDLKYWKNEVAVQFGIESIPASFILDPAGKIIARDLRGADLGAFLSKTLK